MWDEITYPFPNFNGATDEVNEWISDFVPHFIMDVHARIEVNPCYLTGPQVSVK